MTRSDGKEKKKIYPDMISCKKKRYVDIRDCESCLLPIIFLVRTIIRGAQERKGVNKNTPDPESIDYPCQLCLAVVFFASLYRPSLFFGLDAQLAVLIFIFIGFRARFVLKTMLVWCDFCRIGASSTKQMGKV